jgi:cytochrome c oxidase subunit 2
MLQRISFLIMRISIGLVFLLFGIGKLNNDVWAQTIKTMDIFQHLPWDVNNTVILIGISEITTGICLMTGLYARIFAAVASLQLAMILVLLKFGETRDIGLLGATVYMVFTGQDSWGMDEYLRSVKGSLKGMRKYFGLALVCLLLILTGSFALVKGGWQGTHQVSKGMNQLVLSGKLKNGVRMIDVKASKYKFEPNVIVVKAGERIRLQITSLDDDHGFAISELSINETIPAGKTKSFEFVAPGVGTYTAFCSVYCGPGHKEMSASFIVVQ